MTRILISLLYLVATVVVAEEIPVLAKEPISPTPETVEERLSELERKHSSLDQKISYQSQNLDRRLDDLEDNAASGIALFVSGIFCALWAQFTRRSAWVWFFFGVFLAPVALITMVWKTARGLASGDLRFWTQE